MSVGRWHPIERNPNCASCMGRGQCARVTVSSRGSLEWRKRQPDDPLSIMHHVFMSDERPCCIPTTVNHVPFHWNIARLTGSPPTPEATVRGSFRTSPSTHQIWPHCKGAER